MADEPSNRVDDSSAVNPKPSAASTGPEPPSREEPEETTPAVPLKMRVLRLTQAYQPALAEHERARAELQEDLPETAALIESYLGSPGRMVGGSKTAYSRRYPSRLVVFNANLLVAGRKLWWGDLDLSEDVPRLRRLARELGDELHVLYEHDGRFHGRDRTPLVENYVYWTDGRRQQLGGETATRFEFRRGRPRRRGAR